MSKDYLGLAFGLAMIAIACVFVALSEAKAQSVPTPAMRAQGVLAFTLGRCHWRATEPQQAAVVATMTGEPESQSPSEREFRQVLLELYEEGKKATAGTSGPWCNAALDAANTALRATRGQVLTTPAT